MGFTCSTQGCDKEATVAGKCKPCYMREYAARKKAENAEPLETEGGATPPHERPERKERMKTPKENKPDTDVIGSLTNKFHVSIGEARKCHEALRAIKDLTGADFEIPDFE